MTSEKNAVRAHAKKFRDQLDISPDLSQSAADHFINSINPQDGFVVSVYYPIGSEIDPSPIVQSLWERHITVCLPCITGGERALKFAKWEPQTKLVKALFGTVEPEHQRQFLDPDILVIPLLAFDQRGNRMGYGQGHYDETLRGLRQKKEVLAVGLAYAEQAVLLALPTEPHDQKLDFVVTPQRVFDFRI